MKSYIKLYGPPLIDGLKAMRTLAKDLPKLSKGAISEETLYSTKGLPINKVSVCKRQLY